MTRCAPSGARVPKICIGEAYGNTRQAALSLGPMVLWIALIAALSLPSSPGLRTEASASLKGALSPVPRPRPGRLPPEVIQRVVRSHFGAFRGCYEASLRMNPLSPTVHIGFTIDARGKVRGVTATSDYDRTLDRCIAREVRSLTFPPPEGGPVRVRYPIFLSPGP